MELNGKVVGFDDKFFDSKYDTGELPPLHPRCRCVIIYREIESPVLRSASRNGKINTVATNILQNELAVISDNSNRNQYTVSSIFTDEQ